MDGNAQNHLQWTYRSLTTIAHAYTVSSLLARLGVGYTEIADNIINEVTMERGDVILEALERVDSALENVRKYFPETPKMKNTTTSENPDEALKLLKRVDGIIKNYNESNAEMKVRQLMAFFSSKR